MAISSPRQNNGREARPSADNASKHQIKDMIQLVGAKDVAMTLDEAMVKPRRHTAFKAVPDLPRPPIAP